MTIIIQDGYGVNTEEFAKSVRKLADGIADDEVHIHELDSGVSAAPDEPVAIELHMEFSVSEELSNELVSMIQFYEVG